MHISWLGATTIKLQTRPFDDVTIIIDPYRPNVGNFPRSFTPQVALFTHGTEDAVTLSGNPFILDTPGECDIKGVLITAVPGDQPDSIMLRIDAEGMSLAHLGLVKTPLTEQQRELLSDIDVLFVPVGGTNSYDAEAAVKAVNDLEPRVVIPIAFKCDTDPKADPIDGFLKEMGHAGNGKPEPKVILKKKDLPIEDTQVVVLEKE